MTQIDVTEARLHTHEKVCEERYSNLRADIAEVKYEARELKKYVIGIVIAIATEAILQLLRN